jgi:hypothetical protein
LFADCPNFLAKYYWLFFITMRNSVIKNSLTKLPIPKEGSGSSNPKKDVGGQLDSNYKQITALPVHWLFALGEGGRRRFRKRSGRPATLH